MLLHAYIFLFISQIWIPIDIGLPTLKRGQGSFNLAGSTPIPNSLDQYNGPNVMTAPRSDIITLGTLQRGCSGFGTKLCFWCQKYHRVLAPNLSNPCNVPNTMMSLQSDIITLQGSYPFPLAILSRHKWLSSQSHRGCGWMVFWGLQNYFLFPAVALWLLKKRVWTQTHLLNKHIL